jgi:hypothetical protein
MTGQYEGLQPSFADVGNDEVALVRPRTAPCCKPAVKVGKGGIEGENQSNLPCFLTEPTGGRASALKMNLG